MSLLLLGAGGKVAGSAPASNTHSLDLEQSSSQYAFITDAAQTGLDITGDITLECWVRFESIPGDYGQRLISKDTGSGPNRSYQMSILDIGGARTLRITICNDGSSAESLSKSITITTGTWYHFAISWVAATATATFYQNGVSLGTATGTKTSIANTSTEFRIGSEGAGGATFLDGLIDEVRVWAAARSGADINTYKEADVSGQANLRGYWKFNNGYTDSSPNGNTLTPSGSPSFVTTVPFANYNP